MGLAAHLSRFLPCLEWGRGYTRETLASDVTAAVIVTIMLIPQSLAYAMLAGLPPEVGLYASMMPLVLYAVFGTSRTLAVGPVAVASLMSAAAVGAVVKQGTLGYVEASVLLALLSAACLLLMGFFRLGFLANFLSHPVISGFISASGILIAVSQFKHVLGVKAAGHTLPEVASSLVSNLPDANGYTVLIGVSCLAFLWFVRLRLGKLLAALGVAKGLAGFIVKAGPVLTVVVTIVVTSLWQLDREGVAIVGAVPAGLPAFSFTVPDMALVKTLLLPAFLISVIGFVESVSVAQTLAAKRRQRIDPNQELIALGAANLGSGLSGGYVVTGGFARSVVNFDAGAQTPAAGVFTAVGMAVATLFLTPLIHYLPKATLAATIIVAVLALVDFRMMREIWVYSKRDFLAMAATVALTLGVSVEVGVASGVVLSILLHLYKSSRPHCAVVGLVPGTEHFRNVLRHEVETCETIVTLRIDESLYFANARFLEDKVYSLLAARAKLKHVVLMCPAVNEIDASALESLEAINHRLASAGVKFHLSEVKGPVMDRLKRSHFLEALSGQVFLSQYQAYKALAS